MAEEVGLKPHTESHIWMDGLIKSENVQGPAIEIWAVIPEVYLKRKHVPGKQECFRHVRVNTRTQLMQMSVVCLSAYSWTKHMHPKVKAVMGVGGVNIELPACMCK
jgi:hypothetical protein